MKKGEVNEAIKGIVEIMQEQGDYHTIWGSGKCNKTTENTFNIFVNRLKNAGMDVISVYFRNTVLVHDVQENTVYTFYDLSSINMERIKDMARKILIKNNLVILTHNQFGKNFHSMEPLIFNLNYARGITDTKIVVYHVCDTERGFKPHIGIPQNTTVILSSHKEEINVAMKERRCIRNTFFQNIEKFIGKNRDELFPDKDDQYYYFGDYDETCEISEKDFNHYIYAIFDFTAHNYYYKSYRNYIKAIKYSLERMLLLKDDIITKNNANDPYGTVYVDTPFPMYRENTYSFLYRNREISVGKEYTIDELYDKLINEKK